jgi:hypothetical protein
LKIIKGGFMTEMTLLHTHLNEYCPEIHSSRLQSVMDVATALQSSQNLSLTAIGRHLASESDIKHRIKKVDRLMSNSHLYEELSRLYAGMSNYLFQYVSHTKEVPLLIDLCYMKDGYNIQMLSAEIATKGRSLPIYREVFEINHLKGKSKEFISKLSRMIPSDRKIIVIMDAGFGDDWFEAIENQGWYWLARVRKKRYVKLELEGDWYDVGDLFPLVGVRAKSYENASITKKKARSCRIVTKYADLESKRKRPQKLPRNYNSANGNYQRMAKEPWILATNLPKEFSTTQVINYYKKRMQIEESFRDVKSHQYGLGGRDIRTRCIYRWSIMMLLAAIAQITLWIIGVIGHSMGFQKKFQANTVKDKKVFSYFYLGMLIVEHRMVEQLHMNSKNLMNIIIMELERDW